MQIGFLADIHANALALEKVLAVEKGVQEWWFLGDVVGYGPRPIESLRLLQKMVPLHRWIIGNHDAMLAEWLKANINNDAQASLIHHRQAFQNEDSLWAWCLEYWGKDQSSPRELETPLAKYTFVHAFAPELKPNDYLEQYTFPWKDDRNGIDHSLLALEHLPEPEDGRTAVLIHAHTHVPYARGILRGQNTPVLLPIRYDDQKPLPLHAYRKIILCPGSVGQPRNPDTEPHAAFAILDTDQATFSFRRVPYDTEPVIEEMLYQGYGNHMGEYLRGAYPENPHWGNPIWKHWPEIYRPTSWGWEAVEENYE